MTFVSSTPMDSTQTLVFLRRQQVAELIIELAFNEAARQNIAMLKGLLIDALYRLSPECFIADDWSCILNQVVDALLQLDADATDRPMPAPLLGAINQLRQRLT